jgi:hypothetical protein
MDVPSTRTERRFADLDLAGYACYVVALWGLAIVVRGAVATVCLGCAPSHPAGRDAIVTGTLVLTACTVAVWARGARVAASAIVAPGIVASAAAIAVPAVPLALAGLVVMPWSIAASRAAIRDARPREVSAATWAFATTVALGSLGTAPAAAAAGGIVLACALAAPDAIGLRLPRVPDVVPDGLA